MSGIEPIIGILTQQTRSYGRLFELLKRERECLVRYDRDGFEQLAKEKDSLVIQLRLLEEERCRLTDWFFESKGIMGERSITRLWQVSGDNMLMTLKYRLLSLVQGIEELNSFNSVLIQRTLDYLTTSSLFFDPTGGALRGVPGGSLSTEA